MAAFIKRILNHDNAEHQTTWAYRAERKRFEQEQQSWKNEGSPFGI